VLELGIHKESLRAIKASAASQNQHTGEAELRKLKIHGVGFVWDAAAARAVRNRQSYSERGDSGAARCRRGRAWKP